MASLLFFSAETLILLITFVCLVVMYSKWTFGTFEKMGIPGPKPIMFFGTLSKVNKVYYLGDQECAQQYGRMWGLFESRKPMLAVMDPDMLKSILVKECFTYFTNRRNFGLTGDLYDAVNMAEDDQWRRIRNIMSPAFTSGRLKDMFIIMKQQSSNLTASLQSKAQNKEVIAVKDFVGAYSMDVVASCAFSVNLDTINNPSLPLVKHASNLFAFPPLLFLLQAAFPIFLPILDWLGYSFFPEASTGFLKAFVEKIISARKGSSQQKYGDLLQNMMNTQTESKSEKKGLSDHEVISQGIMLLFAGYETTATTLTFLAYCLARNPEVMKRLQEEIDSTFPNKYGDLLQNMMNTQTESKSEKKGLSDHEVISQGIMLLFAGYETTATTLTFLAYCLARNPEVMKRLQEEIDSTFPNKGPVQYENLLQMEYLDCVVNECLRLYPPGARLERVAKETVKINGITIPKDMLVMVPVYAIHRDPEFWPEPEEFKPDRFSKQNKQSINPYTYLPFGHGPRNCIGMRFALVMIKLALVEVLQNYSFEVCEETEIPLQMDPQAIVGPKTPIKLRVLTRS